MNWIKCDDITPLFSHDILVSDGAKCWVAKIYDGTYIASHPDYDREPKNEHGDPFLTYSKPTHWMPLPEKPE